MDCYNENMPISDYCNHCKITINFSFELYNAIKKYLDNNGKLDNLETLSVETCIPLWREAYKTWSLNIDDLNEKKTISSRLEDKMLSELIYNMPENLEERNEFIIGQSGIAAIQLTRYKWFPIVFNNILEIFNKQD